MKTKSKTQLYRCANAECKRLALLGELEETSKANQTVAGAVGECPACGAGLCYPDKATTMKFDAERDFKSPGAAIEYCRFFPEPFEAAKRIICANIDRAEYGFAAEVAGEVETLNYDEDDE